MPAALEPLGAAPGKQAQGVPYRVSIASERALRHRLSQRWVRDVVRVALSSEGVAPRGRVEVLLAGDATVRRLNAAYLGEDHVTDVLSFPSGDGFPGEGPWREIGQIVLSLPQTTRQAREAGRPLGEEAAHLLVHGVLHLLGHDHVRPKDAVRMRAREEDILRHLTVDPTHVHAEGES